MAADVAYRVPLVPHRISRRHPEHRLRDMGIVRPAAAFLQDYIEQPLNTFLANRALLRWLSTDSGTTGRDMLCAGLILGIMILPIITVISRDVL